jgi:redox-sensitive bicupin YhaK (pirin superfamily)
VVALEVHPSRDADVGGLPVRRALPWHGRRTVGAWCFVDHFGPVGPDQAAAMQVGPHPHIGLQTVTWLLEGEVVHTDSLGSEQRIRPGQLNLMTAGRGIAHAESGQPGPGAHGAQLWVALPEATRHGLPAFEHHASVPAVELGPLTGSLLVGELAGVRSPARADTPIVGADIALRPGRAVVPLEPAWEHALVVLEGAVLVAGETTVVPGSLAHLAPGPDELGLEATSAARLLLLGGPPFEAEPIIWWNFVGRTRDEIDTARAAWQAGDEDRFGWVDSHLDRIPAPEVPW